MPRKIKRKFNDTKHPDNLTYTIALFVGEGSAICRREKGRIPRPEVSISMCDKTALQPTQPIFQTTITKSSKHECKPTPQNPEGYDYKIRAVGTRAENLMNTFLQNPYLSQSKKEQIERVKKQCPHKPKFRKRLKKKPLS